MDIETFRTYCLGKKGATESFPFSKLPDLLVFKVCGKMFSATDISTFDSITLKCDPDIIDELRATHPAVTPPSYMSNKHWNSITMDNSIPNKLLKSWIDNSYKLVVAKLTKREKEKLSKL